MIDEKRAQLLQIFSEALRAVDGRARVRDQLRDLAITDGPVAAVAIGKAAASMMQGALDVLDARIEQALVITKYHHARSLPGHINIFEAAHPVSDENSLLAGQALYDFVTACPQTSTLLVLLSGGASALAEVLPPGMTLDELKRMNQWLLAQPFTIQQINAVRKAVSMIKGGKLLQQLRTWHCYQLILSDVPGNDLQVIGSGLFVQEQQPQHFDMTLPAWLAKLIQPQGVLNRQQQTVSDSVQHFIVADNQTACDAASHYAKQAGISVVLTGVMSGDAETFARSAVQQIKDGANGLYIWGGETHLKLPPTPGVGGRCQHIALTAAQELAGAENVVLLAGATDGTDGPGDIAGALIDGRTLWRGEAAGFDATSCLRNADSGRFLEASGDLLDTGPTGTNVNDIVLALKW